MTTRTRRAASRTLLAASMALLATGAMAKADVPVQRGVAGPAFTAINGTPLTVHVGADQSFQILNSAVPGSGQIYPSDATETADMGWFVRVGGTLYSPDFSNHPAGSATSGLGPTTPFTSVSLSPASGDGSPGNPFRVTVQGALGTTGLTATMVTEYVNGNSYFTKRFTLSNGGTAAQDARIFVGGDIYLADSDSGVPFVQSASVSPGGQDCATPPTYTILYIPQTPADAFAARQYSTVWNQIGTGQLDSTPATGCMDNGAALQWNRSLAPGASVTVQAATSFGEIPPIALFNVSAVTPASGPQGAFVPVTITGFGFQPGTMFDFGDGIAVGQVTIVNGTTATAMLTIAGNAALGPRDVTGTQSPDGLTAVLPAGFTVTAAGDPPPPPPPPPPGTAQPVPAGDSAMLLAMAVVLLLGAGLAMRRY